MKRMGIIFVLLSTIMLTACPVVEQNARDTAAALKGVLATAQAQYLTECRAMPTEKQCQIINQAVDGQNALVTAVEAYCGWSPTAPPPDPTAKCVPVKSAEGGLKTALANASLFIVEVRGVLKK